MVNKVTRQKASHQVLAQLKAGISDGSFPVGEKLPSENTLAEAFGVSRVPVREALGILGDQRNYLLAPGGRSPG